MSHSTDINDQQQKISREIHDSAVDAIITITDSGVIESVNPATEKLFGYQATELLGNNVNMLMPPPFGREHDGYIQNFLETGVKKIIGIGREVVARRKDGSVFPIHLAVSEIEVSDKRLFVGIVRDLSEFKSLEEHQTTLGRIIEDSLNEVYIFDAESLRFIQLNRGARENLGYSIEELRRMTPMDLKPEYSEDRFRELIEPLAKGQVEKLEFETLHERADKTAYDVQVHLQKVNYRNRPAFIAIILDITRRRNAERAIQKQREAMQAELEGLITARTQELKETQSELIRAEKYSTLGKVSGGIAHEIRNPLNAVKTSAYYLLNASDPSPEKIREHLERIDRQVTLIDNAVTALSDVARLPDANLKAVNLEPILREAAASVSLPSNIDLKFDFPDNLPKVRGDEDQIVIGFKNLVRNASEAMPDGGTIAVGARVEGDSVTFFVSDTGIGISPEMIDQILEPLFTTKARGMGLGLSITQAIVEKNRGMLHVESDVGKGSRFCFQLQRVESAAST